MDSFLNEAVEAPHMKRLAIQAFSEAVRVLSNDQQHRSEFAEIHSSSLFKLCRYFRYAGTSEQMITNFIEAAQTGVHADFTAVRTALGEIVAHGVIKNIASHGTLRDERWQWDRLYRFTTATAGLHLALWHDGSSARRATSSSEEHERPLRYRRGISSGYIFIIDERQGADHKPAVEQFGTDLTARTGILNHNDWNGFPGPGYVLEKS